MAICARTEADLEVAERDLRNRGGDVISLVCDVRDRDQVESMVDQTIEHFGSVDVLMNVAGIIGVGPLDSMTVEDFHDTMDTNCWGALHTSLAVLPHMRRQKWGRIVNVASIGGKQAVPHLLPYTVSKFALVGLSNGLRTELAKDGILVTTICPSLMRTGSPRNASFKAHHRLEYAWFNIAGSMPVASMSADRAARQLLRACQNGDGEMILKNPSNLGITLQQIAPQWTTELLSLINQALPGMGGIGQQEAKGYESESDLSPSLLTRLGDLAAARNNEVRRRPK